MPKCFPLEVLLKKTKVGRHKNKVNTNIQTEICKLEIDVSRGENKFTGLNNKNDDNRLRIHELRGQVEGQKKLIEK